MSQDQFVFGCAVISAEGEAQACLLAKSLRTYGGRFSDEPVWVFVPAHTPRLTEGKAATLKRLGVQTLEFDIDPVAQGFPFAGKVMASAMAEELAADDLSAEQAELLVWMDPDSIVFQEPEAFILQPDKALGCRPVDHTLIGSPADQPIDAFWRDVYRMTDVSEERLFPMITSADQIGIRPYVNAGFLVVRPKLGLLRRWRTRFIEALAAEIFESYFEKDILYRIFLHQAILAGVVLSGLRETQIQILSHLINYPMHMHGQYPLERRPARMNELVSGRHDTFFENPEWPELFASDKPVGSWLRRQLREYGLAGGEM